MTKNQPGTAVPTWHNREQTTSVKRTMSPNRVSKKLLPAIAAMVLLLAGCAEDKPLNTFEPRGERAVAIDSLMTWIWVIMAVVFVLVIGGALILTVKNRVRAEDFDHDDLPEQTHGNTGLELAWTILPAVLLAGICIPMVRGIWELEEKNDPGELDVMVIGQQWWWEYRYDADGDGFFQDGNGDGVVDERDQELPLELVLDPDDIVTANELVIPAGQQIDLTLTSRDVIHSFWIPRLNGKRDTVPGRWHTWQLSSFEPGKYTGWCTEYCGLSHARMRMSTIALPQAEFDQWFESQKAPAALPEDADALAGREIFLAQGCTNCHIVREETVAAVAADAEAGIEPVTASAAVPTDPNEAAAYWQDFRSKVPLVSKAAPDLTHFASRSTYAGGIFGTYAGEGTDPNDDALDVSDYLRLSELSANPQSADDYRWNSPELKRWVKNASKQKAMASEPVDLDPDDPDDIPVGRGMLPYEELSDEDLDKIVAYLATLD